MIIPILCFTCGEILGDKWEYYKKKVDEYKKKHVDKKDDMIHNNMLEKPTIENDVLNELGLTKMCCRRHMLTHVDIIDDI